MKKKTIEFSTKKKSKKENSFEFEILVTVVCRLVILEYSPTIRFRLNSGVLEFRKILFPSPHFRGNFPFIHFGRLLMPFILQVTWETVRVLKSICLSTWNRIARICEYHRYCILYVILAFYRINIKQSVLTIDSSRFTEKAGKPNWGKFLHILPHHSELKRSCHLSCRRQRTLLFFGEKWNENLF